MNPEPEERPLRVVHIDTGRSWRGGQQQVLLLHRELLSRDIASLVVAHGGGELVRRCRADGLPASALPGSRAWNLRAWSVLQRSVRSADIIHVHDSHAAGLAALAGRRRPRPAVVCHRRVSYPIRLGITRRWKYGSVDRWIAVTEEIGDILRRSGVPTANLYVVPSAVDLDRFRATAAAADVTALRRELRISDDTAVVGMTGAFERQKGHAILVSAARQILAVEPEVVFLCIGEGPLRRQIVRHVAARGLEERFRFTGFRQDVPALTRLFTVAVVSSVDGEGSSATLKEAMALAKPIVASDLVGNREVLGDAGILVRAGDEVEFAKAIARLLGAPGERRRLGRRAAAVVERFRVGRMTDGVIEVYRLLAANRPATGGVT